jgi:hypothetical protein
VLLRTPEPPDPLSYYTTLALKMISVPALMLAAGLAADWVS